MSADLRPNPALAVARLAQERHAVRRRRERFGRLLAATGAAIVVLSILVIPAFLLFELLPHARMPEGVGGRFLLLLAGTLKAGLIAVLVAFPIGLGAAIHIVCFATGRWRAGFRAVLDVLAAIPTVVLGLIALTWLAPWLRSHVATLLVLAAVALAAVLVVSVVFGRPLRARRSWLPLIVLPMLVLVAGVIVGLDPLVDAIAVDTPWNGLLVGLALGVAAIPLVCAVIGEVLQAAWDRHVDAAIALGASRWQALRSLVLPASAPGLVAAALLAFGRCTGETMVLLMASGNTPIASLDPRDGLRSLSAELALSLPGAERGSLAWQVLLFATLALFLLSFACNFAAGRIRGRLSS